jgi:hypothetical protein
MRILVREKGATASDCQICQILSLGQTPLFYEVALLSENIPTDRRKIVLGQPSFRASIL